MVLVVVLVELVVVELVLVLVVLVVLVLVMSTLPPSGLAYVGEKDEEETMFISMPQVNYLYV